MHQLSKSGVGEFDNDNDNNNHNHNNSFVNNKILESDWFSAAFIYCLIWLMHNQNHPI